MKIKKFKIFFFLEIPKSSGHIDYSNPHMKSEPNRCNSLNNNRLDGWTDGQMDGRTPEQAHTIP